jgi:DNA gyrase/topoisomerase IV subunit A
VGVDPEDHADAARRRLAALLAMKAGLDRYREVTEAIAASADRAAAVVALQELLSLDETGARVVLELQWGRLTRDTLRRVHDDIAEVRQFLRGSES